jgi:hypothetical protein
MKPLCNIAAAVSLVLVACGVFFAWKAIVSQGSLAPSLSCFSSAFALSLSAYVFLLSKRIAAFEKALAPSK